MPSWAVTSAAPRSSRLCSWATTSAASTSTHRGAADAPRLQPSGAVGEVGSALVGGDKCGTETATPLCSWVTTSAAPRSPRHCDDKCGTEIAAPLCSWATTSAAWTSAHRGAADTPRWQPSGGGAVGGAGGALVGDDKCGTEIATPLCSWVTTSAASRSAHRGAADAPRLQPSGAVGGVGSALVGGDKCGTEIATPLCSWVTTSAAPRSPRHCARGRRQVRHRHRRTEELPTPPAGSQVAVAL